MGDIADMLLENEIAYGSFWMERDDEPRVIHCKFCGCTGLKWVQHDGGWRLHDSKGNPHSCRQYHQDRANQFYAHVSSALDKLDNFKQRVVAKSPVHAMPYQGGTVKTTKNEILLTHFILRGATHHDYQAGDVQPGELLVLEADPDNLHDRYAVKVCQISGNQIGWMPMAMFDRMAIQGLLLAGYPLIARAIDVDMKKPVWEQLCVGVWIPKARLADKRTAKKPTKRRKKR